MTKRKTQILTLTMVILLVLAAGCYAYLINGALIKRVHLSSDSAIRYYTNAGQELLFNFQAQDIRIFIVNDEGQPKLYTLKKKLAWWVYDYPSYSNIQAITAMGDDVYICSLGKPQYSMYLEAESGDSIDPVQAQTIKIQDAASGPDQYVVNIFKIEDYAEKPGNYRVMVQDETGITVNAKADELDLNEITLVLLEPGGTQEQTYTPQDVAAFEDERAQVLTAFIETIADKTAIEPMGFEGSKLPTTQMDISTTTYLDSYYTIAGSKQVYAWTHRVTYQLMLNGDHYKNILTRHESRPPLGASKVTFYQVDSSAELRRIYNLFFPQQ